MRNFLLIFIFVIYGAIVSFMIILTSDPKSNIDLIKQASRQSFVDYPVLADLTAAQAILESNLTGTPSQLAKQYNNLFGIKGEGTAGSVQMITHEFYNGSMHEVSQAFAVNNTLEDSFDQHRKLFEDLQRYQNLFNARDFNEAAQMIYKDGYATDLHYSQELIDIYNEYLK